jgi:hypothetical protein
MPTIWRGMMADGDKPKIAPGSAQGLGVRACDLPVGENGQVQPGTGGMSVADRPESLPLHRVPRRLQKKYPERFPDARASDNYHCWHMGEGAFVSAQITETLNVRPDPKNPETHGFVEPGRTMLFTLFEQLLADTQPMWHRWEE